jgi:hypothetical protein
MAATENPQDHLRVSMVAPLHRMVPLRPHRRATVETMDTVASLPVVSMVVTEDLLVEAMAGLGMLNSILIYFQTLTMQVVASRSRCALSIVDGPHRVFSPVK